MPDAASGCHGMASLRDMTTPASQSEALGEWRDLLPSNPIFNQQQVSRLRKAKPLCSARDDSVDDGHPCPLNEHSQFIHLNAPANKISAYWEASSFSCNVPSGRYHW
ncbi:MAG: hypothetical protein QOD84_1058 [Acidobacteriaceae bacterium]|jgi:hypothetical protein